MARLLNSLQERGIKSDQFKRINYKIETYKERIFHKNGK